jgi:tRNA nucleotidyltransferase/poly(A) polymerase
MNQSTLVEDLPHFQWLVFVFSMKLPRHIQQLSKIGPVYLVGGSVRDRILNRPSSDHDFVVPGDAKGFSQKVADLWGTRVIAIGEGKKINYRVVSQGDVFDFADMEGQCIEDDLKRRDFTINAIGYDLVGQRLIDPWGGRGDITCGAVRLTSKDAIVADPLRILRAFRFAALLDFSIASETLTVIKKELGRIEETSKERITAELMMIMGVDRSFRWIKQIADMGLLALLIPELDACRGCTQNDFHGMDVFDHTMETYRALEFVLSDPVSLWSGFSRPLTDYLSSENRKVLLKWVALFHDLGKPGCRSVDPTGRIRFLGHEKAGARLAKAICQRLRMSNHDRSYIMVMVENHLRPLHLFDAHQRGNLTAKGIVRFVKKFGDQAVGLLIHGVADQQAKGHNGHFSEGFVGFGGTLLSVYFDDLKLKMKMPRLVSGHDLLEIFNLKPSRFIGRLLEKLEEARLSGDIETREEALKLAALLIEMEGDAGIEQRDF